MATSASVVADGSWPSRLDRALLRLETALALLAGLAVLALIGLAAVSVGGRNLINQPVPGYVDWIEQAMPLIAFMGLSFTQRSGGHVRMDILIGRLKGRPLWAAEALTTALTLAVVLLLIWGTWAHFGRSFDPAAPLFSRDSTMDIGLPIWPAKLVVPVAFSVLALRLAVQLWGYAAALVSGARTPGGVPLVLSAAEIARAEAETLMDASENPGR